MNNYLVIASFENAAQVRTEMLADTEKEAKDKMLNILYGDDEPCEKVEITTELKREGTEIEKP